MHISTLRRKRTLARVMAVLLCLQTLGTLTAARAEAPRLPRILALGVAQTVAVSAGGAMTLRLPAARPDAVYQVSAACLKPEGLSPGEGEGVIGFRLHGSGHTVIPKRLHAGDGEFFFLYQPRAAGVVTLSLTGGRGLRAAQPVRVEVQRLPVRAADQAAFEREPNDWWQEANRVALGRTVWAGADDRDYLGPATEVDTVSWPPAEETVGIDWYRFEYRGPGEVLCQFNLELLDRDVPVNVKLFRQERPGAEPVEYTRGKDPDEIRHDMQIELAYKHVTRVLTPGTYYLQVEGRHPFYQLKTKLYPVPPYKNPRQAVRTATDYALNTGDSWFAHTPRAGSVKFRLSNVSDETERCVACHPTQFPTRAALVAHENGYDVLQRWQLRYLVERMQNAPVPFPGHEGANWTRFDLAPNNNLSRTADIVRRFEGQISHQPTAMLEQAAGFIRLSWGGLTELPKEEFDGNLPISSFKIAQDAANVLGELKRRTGRAEDGALRERIKDLLETAKPKDVQELCDQTLAMLDLDRVRYRDAIARNIARLRELQHEDGGWVRGFDEPKSDKSLLFMAGQGAYTLAKAGVPREDPAVQRAAKLLISRQKAFGGWLDDKGEPFLTPFLESKWAVRALSQLYPGSGRRNGWNSTAARIRPVGRDGLLDTLTDLDQVWDPPAPVVRRQIVALLDSPEPLVRFAAASALGRIGEPSAASALSKRLADPTKMVGRASAWALRQLGSHGHGLPEIRAGLGSPDARTRRGATRVFAQLFTLMAGQKEMARRLVAMVEDPDYLTRLQATKAAWRWYYRTDDMALKASIADAVLGRLGTAGLAKGERINLAQSLHNLLDGNERLFFDQWLPRMTEEQRKVATAGWDAEQRMLVERIVAALQSKKAPLLDGVLRQFGYNFDRPRIGNDTEMIAFTKPETAREFLTALRPYLRDPRPEVHRWAVQAAATGYYGETVEVVRDLVQDLRDRDPKTRELAGQSLRRFKVQPAVAEAVRPDLLALLKSEDEDARAGALGTILSHPTLHEAALVDAVLAAYETSRGRAREEAVRNLSWVYDSHKDTRVLPLLEAASAETPLQPAVIEALRTSAERNGALHTQETALVVLRKLAAVESADVRVVALDVIRRSETLKQDARILPILKGAILDPLPRVRLAAAQQLAAFLKQPEATETAKGALRLALVDADEPTRTAAAGALGVPVPKVTAKAAAEAKVQARLDFDYFVTRVQPIFMKKAADGAACYSCHSTHALLRIAQPGPDGRATEAQLRQNFESAQKVIDLRQPEASLILRKPLSPTENPPPGFLTHAGGPRWPRGADSEEYRTLLAWIKGARLQRAAGTGR
jgi:cellulose synthase operon protein C